MAHAILEELNTLVSTYRSLLVEADGTLYLGASSRKAHSRTLSEAELGQLANTLAALQIGESQGIGTCVYHGVRWTMLAPPLAPKLTFLACQARREHHTLEALNIDEPMLQALKETFTERSNLLIITPLRYFALPILDALMALPEPGDLSFFIGDTSALHPTQLSTLRCLERNTLLAQPPHARDALFRWLLDADWVFCDRLDTSDVLRLCFAGSQLSRGRLLLLEGSSLTRALQSLRNLGQDAMCTVVPNRILAVTNNALQLHEINPDGRIGSLVGQSRFQVPKTRKARPRSSTETPAIRKTRRSSTETPAARPAHPPTPPTPTAAIRRPSSRPNVPSLPSQGFEERPASSQLAVPPAPERPPSDPRLPPVESEPRKRPRSTTLAGPKTGTGGRAGSGLFKRARTGMDIPAAEEEEQDPLADIEADFSLETNDGLELDDALSAAVGAAFDDDITFDEPQVEPPSSPISQDAGGMFGLTFDDDELEDIDRQASGSSPAIKPRGQRPRTPSGSSSRYNADAVRQDAERGRYKPPARGPRSGTRGGQRPKSGRNSRTRRSTGSNPAVSSIPDHFQEGTLDVDELNPLQAEPTRRAQIPVDPNKKKG